MKYVLIDPTVEALKINAVNLELEDGSTIMQSTNPMQGGYIIHNEDGTTDFFTATDFLAKYKEKETPVPLA